MKVKASVIIFALIAVITVTVLCTCIAGKTSEISFSGMGTVISLKLTSSEKENEKCIKELSDMFSEIENSISANDEKSVLYNVNKSTNETDDKYIVEIAEICKDVYEKSNGAFDFTAGKLVSLWGIGFENAKVPDSGAIAEAVTQRGIEKVNVFGEKVTKSKDIELDFGGAGKGFACDKAKEYLENTKVKKAVVSVGGSLLFYGKKQGGWTVAVKDPNFDGGYALTFSLKDGFVSTSGSYERYFTDENGKTYHHIFDTQTGYPVENDLISVTVVADNGAVSDALSTACFVLDEEKSKSLLEQYNAEAIFIRKDRTVNVLGNIKVNCAEGYKTVEQ